MAWVYILRGARRYYISRSTISADWNPNCVWCRTAADLMAAHRKSLRRRDDQWASWVSIVGKVTGSTLFLMFESMFMTIIAK